MNDFLLCGCDTDSILFCKRDGKPFSFDEQTTLLANLNCLFPERIRWENDGHYDSALVIAAKNYALKQGNKIQIRGSGLKANSREPALREFLEHVLAAVMNDEISKIDSIYQEYENEIENITDPRRWAARKTITEKVMNPTRTNERKIRDAIQEMGLKFGDKVWVLFRPDGSLVAVENWKNDHCKKRLKAKLKQTFEIVKGVLK